MSLTIAVLIDHDADHISGPSLEALTLARSLGEPVAVWVGDAPSEDAVGALGAYGATQVRIADVGGARHPKSLAAALGSASADADVVLMISGFVAKEIATLLALETGAGVLHPRGLASGAHHVEIVVHALRARGKKRDELLPLRNREAVTVDQEAQAPRRAERIGALPVKRDEGVRGVGEIPQPGARSGRIPVDRDERTIFPKHDVRGRDVVVDDQVIGGVGVGGGTGEQDATIARAGIQALLEVLKAEKPAAANDAEEN